ncbi:unnamed protein product [Cyclocybe aegerita]|uniref:Uncharacterized protein n=1 Tax=Cyclocybe aegerita TaxID=1973307 RepID=A0A8S0WXB1_CYCAE|nr:unnamed protein product [Cyclocybe aegerita]
MKVSTSSVILAALAISSSSSTLAAPAGDFEDAGCSPSQSTHSLHHCHPSSATPTPSSMNGRSDILVERVHPSLDLRDVSLIPGNIVQIVNGIPILGPVLGSILKQLSVGGQLGTQAVDGVSEDDMASLKAATAEVMRALNNNSSNVAAPVQNVQNIGAGTSATSKSSSNSPAPTESAEAADAGSNAGASATYYPSSSASPLMPSNPPNTPSLPLPINPTPPVHP